MESVSLARDTPADRMEPSGASTASASVADKQQQQQPAASSPAPQRPAAPVAAKKRSEEKVETAAATSPAPKKGGAEKQSSAPDASSPRRGTKKGSGSEKHSSAEASSPRRNKKLSAEAADEPVVCTHLQRKTTYGPGKSKFDFALVTRKSRVAQLTALTVQMYVIHSEWDRIGNFHFVLLFVALATHGVNTFMRWRDSIDGRFDLKQIYACASTNLRVQYALAVLMGPLLALFTHWFLVPVKISLVNATLYAIASYVKLVFAVGCFILEMLEVSRDWLKPHVDYVKSYFW